MTTSETKKVLVIGGSRGIGLSIVIRLIERGYDVDYTFHRTEAPDPAMTEALAARETPLRVRAFPCDVGRSEAIEGLRAQVAERKDIYHGLVYAAGVSADSLVASANLAKARATMDINFWGFVSVYTALYRHLDRDQGRVVAIGSIASRRHAVGNGLYAASKAALAAFVRGIGCENGRRGLTANCIEPGYIDTDLLTPYRDALKSLEARIPARRIGLPRDVSGVVAFLLSDEAAYVNGACIAVDGGLTASA